MIPGEYLLETAAILANKGRQTSRLLVSNTGDRPIQVGSHYHFFETNRALEFDRIAAFGMRLNIPAGTAVRFEPGEQREVELASLGGARIAHGANGLVEGELEAAGACQRSLARLKEAGFSLRSEKP